MLLLLSTVSSPSAAETRIPRETKKFREFGQEGFRLGAPVHLGADTLTYDDDTGIATAEGNVELVLLDRTMRADRIVYNSLTGDAELAGKVRYRDADEEFAFDRITINLDRETGVLYNGTIRIRSGNFLISSQRIEKTGKQSFTIERGSLTTCPCDPEPDWKFNIRHARVTLEDYAYGRNVTFLIRDIPVFWLPWGAFPVKVTRQSGFLFPSFASSTTTGFTVTVPYYWAINRWSDATLAVNAMRKRGFQPEAEYRFVLNPESEGSVRGTYFRDRETDSERWRTWGGNVYRSGDWTANARWDVPSDSQYFVDFSLPDLLRSARQAQATGFLGVSGGSGSGELSATWYKEMENPAARADVLQRVPEITATLLPERILVGGIEASGELRATNFLRENGYEELRGIAAASLSRTLVLYPSVSLTPYLFVNVLGDRYEPQGGVRDEAGRIVPGGGATIAAEARKEFPGQGQRRIHLVGTSLGYRYVPRVEQADVPLTDRWSRLAPQSQFVLDINQRFLVLKEGDSPAELASLNIQWAYDVGGSVPSGSPYPDPLAPFARALQNEISGTAGQPQSTSAESDVYARGSVNLSARWKLEGSALVNPVDLGFATGTVGGEWRRDDDNRASLGYRYSADLASDLTGLFVWRPWQIIRLQGQANYSIKSGYFNDAAAGFRLYPRSDCWNVGLSVVRQTQPTNTSVRLTIGLKGIGSVGN
jgi:lipopolysaccharide assembly outer membrane protein LptD (OstA)